MITKIFYGLISFGWLIIVLEGQVLIRTSIRRRKDIEDRDWLELTYEEDWNHNKIFLYEMFFLDLFTCRECGKINRHGKLCEECKEEKIIEEI